MPPRPEASTTRPGDPLTALELLGLLRHTCGPEVEGPDLVRFRCPVCLGGFDDPLSLYRPLVIHDDGRLWCDRSLPRGQEDDRFCWFTPEAPLRVLLDALHAWRTTPWPS